MEWTDLICSDSTQIGDCPGIGISNSDIDTVMICCIQRRCRIILTPVNGDLCGNEGVEIICFHMHIKPSPVSGLRYKDK